MNVDTSNVQIACKYLYWQENNTCFKKQIRSSPISPHCNLEMRCYTKYPMFTILDLDKTILILKNTDHTLYFPRSNLRELSNTASDIT